MANESTPPLDLIQLQAFVLASEAGSVGQAAASLNCAPSVVSRRISELEKVFGGHLFRRTGRGVELTALGLAHLPEARALLASSAQFLTRVRSHDRGVSGTVRLGLPRWAAVGALANIYQSIHRQWPGIDLVVHDGISKQIEEWLISGQIDICVLNTWHRLPAYDASLVEATELVLTGPKDSELLAAETVPLSALHRLPISLPPLPNVVQSALHSAARAIDVEIDIRFQAVNGEMIIDAMRGGLYSVHTPQIAATYITKAPLKYSRIVNPTIPFFTYLSSAPRSRGDRACDIVREVILRLLKEYFARPLVTP